MGKIAELKTMALGEKASKKYVPLEQYKNL
jgi:hypothetical protein